MFKAVHNVLCKIKFFMVSDILFSCIKMLLYQNKTVKKNAFNFVDASTTYI